MIMAEILMHLLTQFMNLSLINHSGTGENVTLTATIKITLQDSTDI